MRKIKYIVVHCSATQGSKDIGAKEIRDWHLARGWKDIGYNAVIRRNGVLEWGRDLDHDGDYLEEIGAHVAGYNSVSLGVCMVGGINNSGKSENNFTPEQFSTLEMIIKEWKRLFPSAIVLGHRDFPDVKKDCPCFDVKEWWSSVNKDKHKDMLNKARPLHKMRTIQGTTVATTAILVNEAKDQIEPLVQFSDRLELIFVILSLLGIAYAIYARLDDREKGLR